MRSKFQSLTFAILALVWTTADADWTRFRGPSGLGVATSSQPLPQQWSPDANLGWKVVMPGPGVSSPIIVGDRVFVTCHSGYGLDRENPGEMSDLMRHLVCLDLKTGEKRWQNDIKATLPEDEYSGVGVPAHGYASHTPVSDGKHIFAFFGKSGVHAFDLDGNEVWQADVGKESDPTKWGSSSSPVLYGDSVIVTAAAESQSIIGLDKATGKELWRQEAEGLDGMWGTPTLIKVDDNRTDLVMCVAKELWGMDPETGKLRWFAEATGAEQAHSSVIFGGQNVFAFTGRGGGSVAVKVGGKGDVSDDNTVWTGNNTSSFGSPVGHKSKIYLIARGIVSIVDGRTGEEIDQVRLKGAARSSGRFGSLDYASPIVVDDQMFYLNGSGQTFVFDLDGEFKQIAVNRVTNGKETFGGTPAVSNGRMIIRSSDHVYCVMDKGETVQPSENAIAKSGQAETGNGPGPGGRPGGFGGRPGGFGGRPGGGANRGGEGRGGEGRGSAGRGGEGRGGEGRGGEGRGGEGRGGEGGGRWDPMSLFTSRDADKDGKLTVEELAGSPMADRMGQLDKDGDKSITQEEFRAGMSGMFGGGRGGRGGGGGWGQRGEDKRPDRPQRPALVE